MTEPSETDPSENQPVDPDERLPADRDLEAAELAESASVQNVVAVTGPFALLMVPLAKVLAKAKQVIGRS